MSAGRAAAPSGRHAARSRSSKTPAVGRNPSSGDAAAGALSRALAPCGHEPSDASPLPRREAARARLPGPPRRRRRDRRGAASRDRARARPSRAGGLLRRRVAGPLRGSADGREHRQPPRLARARHLQARGRGAARPPAARRAVVRGGGGRPRPRRRARRPRAAAPAARGDARPSRPARARSRRALLPARLLPQRGRPADGSQRRADAQADGGQQRARRRLREGRRGRRADPVGVVLRAAGIADARVRLRRARPRRRALPARARSPAQLPRVPPLRRDAARRGRAAAAGADAPRQGREPGRRPRRARPPRLRTGVGAGARRLGGRWRRSGCRRELGARRSRSQARRGLSDRSGDRRWVHRRRLGGSRAPRCRRDEAARGGPRCPGALGASECSDATRDRPRARVRGSRAGRRPPAPAPAPRHGPPRRTGSSAPSRANRRPRP